MKHGERARLLLLRKRISAVEAPYIVAVELGGGYHDAFSLVREAIKENVLPAEVRPVINDWSGEVEDSIDANATTIAVPDLLAWLRTLAEQVPAELPPKLAALAQYSGGLLSPALTPAPLNLPTTLTNVPSAPAPAPEHRFSKPNWAHWMRPGTTVRLWEGICLVVDIEPPTGPGGKEILDLYGIKHLPAKFHEAWGVLNRDEAFSKTEEVGTAGRMLHTTNLDRFAYWAIYKGFDVPPQLRELAARSGMAEEEAADKAMQAIPAVPSNAGSLKEDADANRWWLEYKPLDMAKRIAARKLTEKDFVRTGKDAGKISNRSIHEEIANSINDMERRGKRRRISYKTIGDHLRDIGFDANR